jgi:hypothetical protein
MSDRHPTTGGKGKPAQVSPPLQPRRPEQPMIDVVLDICKDMSEAEKVILAAELIGVKPSVIVAVLRGLGAF